MLKNVKSLIGYTLGATDGEIGKVTDFYFDDKTWETRYLVVETGGWLFGRKVLLSPVSIHNADYNQEMFLMNLTKDQIKNSPDIDTDKPVSRQFEDQLNSHYSWPNRQSGGIGFMTTGMVGGVVPPGISFEDQIAEEVRGGNSNNPVETGGEPHGDSHLRSFKDTKPFNVITSEEEVGEFTDLLLNTDNWSLPCIIVETGIWYSGDKIIISTSDISVINDENSTIRIAGSTSSLENSIPFPENNTIDQELERKINSIQHSF